MNLEKIDRLFLNVLDDIRDYLPDLTLVGGWIPYVHSNFLWKTAVRCPVCIWGYTPRVMVRFVLYLRILTGSNIWERNRIPILKCAFGLRNEVLMFLNKSIITGFRILAGIVFIFLLSCNPQKSDLEVRSPDQKISVQFQAAADSTVNYQILFEDSVVLSDSRLGIIREDGDFLNHLSLSSVSHPIKISLDYEMIQGKRRHCQHKGIERIFHLENDTGQKMDVVFRVSNDGAAFRYVFPNRSPEIKKIVREISEFHFQPETKAFLQPMAAAKSGWNQVNPCYEEYYTQGVPIHSLPFSEPGWAFPALFLTGDIWVLLSETAPDRNYCGCRLQQDTVAYQLYIDFPQAPETVFDGPLKPESRLPWKTPWRIIAIGRGLKSIAESTLGTDLAKPSRIKDVSFIKPGRSSWSWVLLKDDSTVYDAQKRFIDYAADMHWEYCLIDAYWNTQIGYEKVQELVDYAKTKGVGILLWYNSAGDWNTAPLQPRDKLLTHEDRIEEFNKLKKMGVKGVKVDFFGGDGQSVMSYYQDIFEDAAQFDLMVNCHGATLPRGWQRTYPNLITTEAVRGFEYVTFEQRNADREPEHACMQTFTRNVFDPMDFTPVCFSEVPNIQRVTSNGFELALSVIFWSGIQHFAETPRGMARVPEYVKDFMRNVPVVWEETRYLGGYPGKFVVMARRSGVTWYVAGINGEDIEREVTFNLDFLEHPREGLMITDGENNRSFQSVPIETVPGSPLIVKMKSNGGFVITF